MSHQNLDQSVEKPWTSEEAAKFLGIHPRTLIRLAKNIEIPAFKIGTHWRFFPSDVDSWMRSKVSSSQLNSVRSN